MRRRDFLKAAPALMAPALAHAQARPLRYIPNAGLSTIDPIWTTALVAGIHGYMVFDTLYGLDDTGQVASADVRGTRRIGRWADLDIHLARRFDVP